MVFMQRVYALNPDGREIGLALFPDVEKLFAGSGIVPSLTVSVFNSDMNMMTVMYAGKDLIHLGKSIDEIGTSQAFRDIAKKVSEGAHSSNLGLWSPSNNPSLKFSIGGLLGPLIFGRPQR